MKENYISQWTTSDNTQWKENQIQVIVDLLNDIYQTSVMPWVAQFDTRSSTKKRQGKGMLRTSNDKSHVPYTKHFPIDDL